MTDIFSKEKRSWLMSRVLPKGNRSTEGRFTEILRRKKLKGWRRGLLLYGKPDFVFIKARIAVFIDGCFWHGCPLHGEIPATNRDRWRKKISGNCKKDKRVTKYLRFNGWHVFRIWEHDLGRARLNCKLGKIRRILQLSL